jgi:hypothetical protein
VSQGLSASGTRLQEFIREYYGEFVDKIDAGALYEGQWANSAI